MFSTAAEHGREIEDAHVGVLLGYYVAHSDGEAEAKSEKYITRARPGVHFTEYSTLGSSEQICQTISRYVEAGAQKFVMRPLCPADETMEQLEIMGTEILPQFVR